MRVDEFRCRTGAASVERGGPGGVGAARLIGPSPCLSMHRAVICRRLHTKASLAVWDSLLLRLEQRRLCYLQGHSLVLIEDLSPIGLARRLDPQNIDSLQAAHIQVIPRHALRHRLRCVPVRSLHLLLIRFGPADASCQVTRSCAVFDRSTLLHFSAFDFTYTL